MPGSEEESPRLVSGLRSTVARQREQIEELEVENARLRSLLSQNQYRIRAGERRILSAANAEGISRMSQRDTELFGKEAPRHSLMSWEHREDTPPPPGTPPPTPPLKLSENSPKHTMSRLQRRNQYKDKNNKEKDISIWIAHDNSTLAQTLSSLSHAEVLLETKRDAQTLCFILGRVAFSGPIQKAPKEVYGPLRTGARGAFLLQIHKTFARIIDLIERSRPGSSDFECLPLIPVLDCVESEYKLNCPNDVAHFFKYCDNRVDIILCPQRLTDHGKPYSTQPPHQISHANWIPYWDSDSPPRKLAPQFRSAGVGYLRLGDDMSRNGLAFLSADGTVFLSDAGSIEYTISSPSSPSETTSRHDANTSTTPTSTRIRPGLSPDSSNRTRNNNNLNTRQSRFRNSAQSSSQKRLLSMSCSSVTATAAGGGPYNRSDTSSSSLARAGASRLAVSHHL